MSDFRRFRVLLVSPTLPPDEAFELFTEFSDSSFYRPAMTAPEMREAYRRFVARPPNAIYDLINIDIIAEWAVRVGTLLDRPPFSDVRTWAFQWAQRITQSPKKEWLGRRERLWDDIERFFGTPLLSDTRERVQEFLRTSGLRDVEPEAAEDFDEHLEGQWLVAKALQLLSAQVTEREMIRLDKLEDIRNYLADTATDTVYVSQVLQLMDEKIAERAISVTLATEPVSQELLEEFRIERFRPLPPRVGPETPRLPPTEIRPERIPWPGVLPAVPEPLVPEVPVPPAAPPPPPLPSAPAVVPTPEVPTTPETPLTQLQQMIQRRRERREAERREEPQGEILDYEEFLDITGIRELEVLISLTPAEDQANVWPTILQDIGVYSSDDWEQDPEGNRLRVREKIDERFERYEPLRVQLARRLQATGDDDDDDDDGESEQSEEWSDAKLASTLAAARLLFRALSFTNGFR